MYLSRTLTIMIAFANCKSTEARAQNRPDSETFNAAAAVLTALGLALTTSLVNKGAKKEAGSLLGCFGIWYEQESCSSCSFLSYSHNVWKI